jgi:uncharacterized membrane protein YkvA (DUF1232 family)
MKTSHRSAARRLAIASQLDDLDSDASPSSGAGSLSEEKDVQKMLDEGGGVVSPRVSSAYSKGVYQETLDERDHPPLEMVDTTVAPPQQRVLRWMESKARSWGLVHLERLVKRKGRLGKTMRSVPINMHRVANQTQLVLELIDDFRAGTYRAIPWRSLVILIAVLLYTVSPADVVPDVVPLFGALDDISLIALATRFVERDLKAYCRFKGYSEDDYFRMEETRAVDEGRGVEMRGEVTAQRGEAPA